VLGEDGRRVPGRDEMRAMVGDGARNLVDRAYAATGGPPPDTAARFARFLDVYLVRSTERTVPYDGVPEALDALRASGFVLGVCTNKPIAPTRRILEATGLARRFDAVVGGDEVGARKPDPRHPLAVLERLRLPPDRASLVGDARNDVLAARWAGLRSVLVGWGYGSADGLLAQPDATAASPADLLPVLTADSEQPESS
jgi:phosphoglycolate phosphatase